MSRHRRGYLSDGSSDSNASRDGDDDDFRPNEDPDERAERELFEGQSSAKRRKLAAAAGKGKARAWEGIFGSDEEEQGGPASRSRAAAVSKGSKRFTAPSFVAPSKTTTQDPPVESEKKSATRRVSSDEEDEEAESRPRIGGIGFGKTGSQSSKPLSMSSFSKGKSTPDAILSVESSSRAVSTDPETAGIGTSMRHREERLQEEVMNEVPPPASDIPSSFGRRGIPPPNTAASSSSPSSSTAPRTSGSLLHGGGGAPRPQRSFMGKAAEPTASKPDPTVTAADLRHLQSISSSFGARMLAKHGWAAGKGLGADESGKAVPIQANIGLQRGQGIGKGVRTEQSKREARARGERFSSDEEAEAAGRNKSKKGGKKATGGVDVPPGKGEGASWKRQRKVKVKVEHKTYEELLAEAGDTPSTTAGVGPILDARTGELRQVSDLANLSLSSWTPTNDKTQLPELRHNLGLILDAARADVLALVKEGKGVQEKRSFAIREVEKARTQADLDASKLRRLDEALAIVQRIQEKLPSIDSQADRPLDVLASDFSALIDDHRAEYDEYELDDVVVGCISQVLGPLLREWQPLESSQKLLDCLLPWKRAFRHSSSDTSSVMTPFDTFLNSLWLPRVRSAINNDWQPDQPDAAVRLVTEWQPLLPRFVFDNILDQLILPKLRKRIQGWRSRRESISMASIVFPWLSVLGDRADDLLDDAKLQIGDSLKRWSAKEQVPRDLGLWRDVFSKGKWDTLVLLNVLPKLSAHLDAHFDVNPRQQDMAPLDDVLAWSTLMRESTFSTLLEEKFFPKWLDTLHFWLTQPNYNADEVASWYHFWKDHLSKFQTTHRTRLVDSKGIEHGLRFGLKLMNDAVSLGSSAPTRLAKPVFKPLKGRDKSSRRVVEVAAPAAPAEDVTFRLIAEQHAAEHDLIFVPTGKSHSSTGKQLFKVSKNVDGRGGVTVYVGEDAVYAMMEDGRFRAVLLDDMVKMARGT